VARPIRHPGDQQFRRAGHLQDALDHLDIRQVIAAANLVDLSLFALVQRRENPAAV
jgi:hypothetical protein